MRNTFKDQNGTRFELVASHAGQPYNWLFLPGGPGGDSRYLHSLIQHLCLPGNLWLIDLPNNGDNRSDVVPHAYDYEAWMSLLVPIAERFQNPIIVGHSFGGMFPLCFPELETLLKGLVIFNSSPRSWHAESAKCAQKFGLPDISLPMQAFVTNPTDETFRAALDACMPYYFPPSHLEQGRKLFYEVPFCFQAALWWQRRILGTSFTAAWVPQQVPTLIIGGEYDAITPLTLFEQDSRFQRPNISMHCIADAGHTPWFEKPYEVKALTESFLNRFL